MKITIKQPTSDEHYGPETTSEQAAIVSRNCLDLAEAYARKQWPDAEIDTALVPETQSGGNRSWSDTTEDDTDPVIEEIDEYISRHWTEEPLWETTFDADAYLAAHPR